MTSRFLLLIATVAALAASMAFREETTGQHDPPQYAQNRTSESGSHAAVSNAVVSVNPADRSIRRELTLAFQRDPDLKDRDLSFIVGNGDVKVSGIVDSEPERERINALAFSIPGVRSIANGVRVSPRGGNTCIQQTRPTSLTNRTNRATQKT